MCIIQCEQADLDRRNNTKDTINNRVSGLGCAKSSRNTILSSQRIPELHRWGSPTVFTEEPVRYWNVAPHQPVDFTGTAYYSVLGVLNSLLVILARIV